MVQNSRMLEIYPTLKCNLRCIHCIQDSPEYLHEDSSELRFFQIVREIDSAGDFDVLCLSGGEPTIYPEKYLLEIIRKSVLKGVKKVVLMTNGIRLSNVNYSQKLIEAGVNRFAISFYGYKESYEAVTKVKGSWRAMMKGIDTIHFLKKRMYPELEIELKILLTKIIFNDLEYLVDFILARWPEINFLIFVTPSISESFKKHIDVLGIRMSEIAPVVRKILDKYLGTKFEPKLKVLRFPPCVLGEKYNRFIIPERAQLKMISPEYIGNMQMDVGLPSKCKKCKYYMNKCTGVRLTYLNYYGDNEFNPIRG